MNSHFARKLAEVAAAAPSADNSQPWQLHWGNGELAVHFAARQKLTKVFGAGSHATLLAVGALIENLNAALAANGVPPTWHWGSALELGKPYAKLALNDTPNTFSYPVGPRERHTNRLAFRSDSLSHQIIERVESDSEHATRVVVVLDVKQRARLLQFIRLSSEARFCNKALHEWLMGSLRYAPEEIARGDGLDVNTLGLPPGGKTFMRAIRSWPVAAALNRIGVYKLLALSEIALLRSAPALVAILGLSEPQNVIHAGRLMSRVWCRLNLDGIAVHPYYVITDQVNRLRDGALPSGFDANIAHVADGIQKMFSLQPGETLHMILRVGYPKSAPTRSKRLPIDAVFVDESRVPIVENAR